MVALTGVMSHRVGSAAPPIFIVGSPRSGTSLLRLILDSHPAIACGPETHVLADLDESLGRHWDRLARYGAEREHWHDAYREAFARLKADYAARRGKARWADKTPAYAQHLQFVTALFPDAQVIHVIRDARHVTASALARWGWRRAWAMPQLWRESVEKAREFGRDADPGRYREVRFEQLVGDRGHPAEGVRVARRGLGSMRARLRPLRSRRHRSEPHREHGRPEAERHRDRPEPRAEREPLARSAPQGTDRAGRRPAQPRARLRLTAPHGPARPIAGDRFPSGEDRDPEQRRRARRSHPGRRAHAHGGGRGGAALRQHDRGGRAGGTGRTRSHDDRRGDERQHRDRAGVRVRRQGL